MEAFFGPCLLPVALFFTVCIQTKLNKTRVLRAAMHDLLTSQCDRHAENIFINDDGNIRLIDNLQARAGRRDV